MIETQEDARRLASIDDAMAIGQLADSVVLAALQSRGGAEVGQGARAGLQKAIELLENISEYARDPVRASLTNKDSIGIENFGGLVTDVAANAVKEDRSSASATAIEDLQERATKLLRAEASEEDLEILLIVFASVAETMLAATQSLLEPRIAPAWSTTPIS